MDELPEFVIDTMEFNGRTYWKVPSLSISKCVDCSFNAQPISFCKKLPTKMDDGTWACHAHDLFTMGAHRKTVIFIHPRYVKAYTAKLVIKRMEGT